MNQPKVKYSRSNWDLVSVNPNYKTWNWKDLFCYWGVNVQSVIGFSLIASLYIMYNLNTFVVLIGTLLGSFFVYLFANFIGKPSQKFGLPFVVLFNPPNVTADFGAKPATRFICVDPRPSARSLRPERLRAPAIREFNRVYKRTW